MATKKEIVEKVNAAFAQNNLEGFLTHCVDDVVFTIVGDRTVKGKEAIRSWMSSMMGAEPPSINIQNVVSEGDFATAIGEMTMKEQDGTPGSYGFCDVYRFRGDKIVELKGYVVKTQPQTASV